MSPYETHYVEFSVVCMTCYMISRSDIPRARCIECCGTGRDPIPWSELFRRGRESFGEWPA